ncbi:MAG: ComEC/Rec2 family competence protein [bacterium]
MNETASVRGIAMRGAAVRALVAVAAGILAARAFNLPWAAWAALALLGLRAASWTRGFTLLITLACVAAVYSSAREPGPPDPAVYRVDAFRGVVVAEPHGPGQPAMLELDPPLRGRVRLWPRDSTLTLRYGEELVVRSAIRPFDYPRNPGLPDRNVQMLRRGVVGRAGIGAGRFRVTRQDRGAWFVRAMVMPARRAVLGVIERRFAGDEAGLLRGLLLGGSSGLGGPVRDAFADAGILHILAVSGMNVGILVGVVWLLLALVGLRGWWRFGIASAAVAGYVMLCGWSAAPARAGLMALAALAAAPLQRKVHAVSSLSCAAIALLAIDPQAFFDIGAQLSFAATLGIVLLVNRLKVTGDAGSPADKLGNLFLRRRDFVQSTGHRLVPRWLAYSLLPALLVALAATAATAPLLLHHFARFQPLSFFSSLVTVPLVGVAMPLGMLVVALDPVPFFGGVFAEALRVVLALLLKVGVLLGSTGWAMVEPGRLSWLGVAWLYISALALSRRAVLRKAGVAVLLVGASVVVWQAALARPRASVAFLDPGQGDAVLLEDRTGKRLLFDAGLDGPGVVRDWLRSRGAHRLDVAVITHPDRDHYGGLLDLDRRVRIGRVVVPTLQGDTVYTRLLARLRGRGAEVVVAGRGTRLEGGGFGVEFLWPDARARQAFGAGTEPSNAVSLVARVTWDSTRILLTGDMERLEEAGSDLRADILKSPHHGSKAGNRDTVFALVRPSRVIVMGRFPTPAGLEARLDSAGIELYNTRESGGMVLVSRGGRLEPQRRGLTSRLTGEN